MSQVIYESDNLTIVGSCRDIISGWTNTEWEYTSKLEYKLLNLIFSMHINWKLRTFDLSFKLVESEFWGEYTLDNWFVWWDIFNMLKSIWYFQDLDNGVIRKWIDQFTWINE